MAKITAIKGMSDLLPPVSRQWQALLEQARLLLHSFGYEEIVTPIVEPTELFVRTSGETSSVVEKQMYTFSDKNGVSLTLRPEATASVVRAYLEAGRAVAEPLSKFYYYGPMFRYEQPQKGRSRQFYQLGVELLGSPEPMADAEVLLLLDTLLEGMGVKNRRLEINSLGCRGCRPTYMKEVEAYLKVIHSKLCEDCQRRAEKNPLRVLDCKEGPCRKLLEGVPEGSQFWCEACRTHFQEVLELLQAGGVKYKENPRIVRGLDYYCRTAFEVLCDDLGSQNAVAAGGRYDGLIQELDGPDLPGIGFAIGVERVLLACGASPDKTFNGPKALFALLGKEAQKKAFPVIAELRKKGIFVEVGYGGSLKSQLRRAQKLGSKWTVIAGDNEVVKGMVLLKNMETGDQQEVAWEKLCQSLS